MAEQKKPPLSADPLAYLLDILDIEALGPDRFSGRSSKGGWGRVYGGQVLAQALVAASRSVEAARPLHSLHGYFLLAGDPKIQIDYEVERLRDGGSFTTRRVTARQNGQAIFAMIGSFHKLEEGFEHANPMPDVPPPEDVAPMAEMFANAKVQVPSNMRAYYNQERPFEIRLVDTERYFGGVRQKKRRFSNTMPILGHSDYRFCACNRESSSATISRVISSFSIWVFP